MSPRPALVVLALALSACGGPAVQVLHDDPRGELETCARATALATLLAPDGAAITSGALDLGSRPWAFAAPCAPLPAEVEAAYRSPTTRGGRLAPSAEAPPEVRAALEAASAALVELGYALQGPGDARHLTLGVSLSTHPDGRLARVAIHAGSELDGRFERDLLAIAAVYDEDEAPPVDDEGGLPAQAAHLVRWLVGALPARDPDAPPPRAWRASHPRAGRR